MKFDPYTVLQEIRSTSAKAAKTAESAEAPTEEAKPETTLASLATLAGGVISGEAEEGHINLATATEVTEVTSEPSAHEATLADLATLAGGLFSEKAGSADPREKNRPLAKPAKLAKVPSSEPPDTVPAEPSGNDTDGRDTPPPTLTATDRRMVDRPSLPSDVPRRSAHPRRTKSVPNDIRAKIVAIEAEARAKGWLAELLWNSAFWGSHSSSCFFLNWTGS